MIQRRDVKWQVDDGSPVCLRGVVCRQTLGLLDSLALVPPRGVGIARARLRHQGCRDRRIRQLTGRGHIALRRIDEPGRPLAYGSMTPGSRWHHTPHP